MPLLLPHDVWFERVVDEEGNFHATSPFLNVMVTSDVKVRRHWMRTQKKALQEKPDVPIRRALAVETDSGIRLYVYRNKIFLTRQTLRLRGLND